MIKKTSCLYIVAKRFKDKILVIDNIIVEYIDNKHIDPDVDRKMVIDEKITVVENSLGCSTIWDNKYLVMKMDHPLSIKDNAKFGVDENLRICMGMDCDVIHLFRDRKSMMTTSEIFKAFEAFENEHTSEAADDNVADEDSNDKHTSLTPEEMIEAEYTEIMELVEYRRMSKKIMLSCSSDSEIYKTAKKYVVELKKEINRRFEMYDSKFLGNEHTGDVETKVEPDKCNGMHDTDIDSIIDNYVYIKDIRMIRLFDYIDHKRKYEFRMYTLNNLNDGLYVMMYERNDGTTIVEKDVKLEMDTSSITVKKIVHGEVGHEYVLTIDTLINDYKSLKIMGVNEYRAIIESIKVSK